MARKLTDVDALFLGTDPVDRMFIGDTLVWNGDNIPELEASEEVYFDVTGYTPTTLANLGTSADDFDLPATGLAVTGIKEWPGLLPGDFAYSYRGDIDPTVGTDPLSLERLVTEYPYLYQGGNIGTGFTIVNSGTEGTSANVTAEASNSQSTVRNMYFPGATTNYLSVPDAANLDLTTQLEITFRAAIMEPDNRLGNQRIVAKSGSSRGYEVFIGFEAAHATLNFAHNGTSVATATIKLPILPEHIYWFRVTYNSAGSTKFYYAPDNAIEPVSWTQLGANVTSLGTSVANAETLKIGTYNGTSDMFKGRLYNLIIRNAETGGATVLNIDIPTDTASMTPDVTTTFTATSGQTVTLTKSGTPPATVRVVIASGWSLADGNRFGTDTNMTELETIENQLQIIWVRATVGAYSTTRRQVWPVLRAYNTSSAPYADNSWSLLFDTYTGWMWRSYRLGGTDGTTETLTSTTGVQASITGTQIFGIALLEQDGAIRSWIFRYNPANHTFLLPTATGTSPTSITGTDLIGTTNTFEMWQGVTGFTIHSVGIVNYPDFCVADDDVRFRVGSGGNLFIDELIEPTIRVVALGESPTYEVGDYWRASADGVMEIASEAVEEGDIFAVKSTTPTWQQIKLQHPSRRKTLFRPRYTTFGYTADPLQVANTEDFFIWVVNSVDPVDGVTDEYMTYSFHTTGDSFMGMEVWLSSGAQNLYMEIDDDDGNAGWFTLNTVTDGISELWEHGHSSPTLLAMGIDRGAQAFYGWIYDSENGYRQYDSEDTDLMTGTLDFDQLDFFGPDVGEGYSEAIYWGGGWRVGIGVIPDEDGIRRLWEQAVYGYSAD